MRSELMAETEDKGKRRCENKTEQTLTLICTRGGGRNRQKAYLLKQNSFPLQEEAEAEAEAEEGKREQKTSFTIIL